MIERLPGDPNGPVPQPTTNVVPIAYQPHDVPLANLQNEANARAWADTHPAPRPGMPPATVSKYHK